MLRLKTIFNIQLSSPYNITFNNQFKGSIPLF